MFEVVPYKVCIVTTMLPVILAEDANLKIVEFDPRLYGVGEYRIVVKMVIPAGGNRKTSFGVAWR